MNEWINKELLKMTMIGIHLWLIRVSFTSECSWWPNECNLIQHSTVKGLFESERGILHEHSKQQSQRRQENTYPLVAIQASVKLKFWKNRGGNHSFRIEEKSWAAGWERKRYLARPLGLCWEGLVIKAERWSTRVFEKRWALWKGDIGQMWVLS